jgi:DNA-binding LacI/PurR family transcriptional regulator
MHVIYEHGLRIPDDVSVIGFDDIPTSAYVIPPLTTVALPAYRMGQLAIHLIRRIQAGEDMRTVEPIVLESPLVIRESTGPVSKK